MVKHSSNQGNIEVVASEFYGDNCLGDAIFRGQPSGRSPKGWVEIWEEDPNTGTKKLVNKSNLIVYLGREYLVQRIFDLNNSSATPTKDEFLYWIGFGSGGVRPPDPLVPIPPTLTDTDLNSLVMISATDSSAADYHVAGGDYPETGFYKYPFDSVAFERDYNNEDKWLVGKITVTLGTALANGNQISEAGLYTAESRNPGYSGQFSLFARVTFPTLIKTVHRRIIFIWYIYT
jgi:hypothetical protein